MLSERVEDCRIGSDPTAVRGMREVVRRMCRTADLPAETRDTAILLTSETLTNAIVHAGRPTRVVVHASPSGIRVEVTDDSVYSPVVAAAGNEATNGRGIRLIDSLATRWGVQHHRGGKTVWFEIAIEPVTGPGHPPA
jgi:anti-sigma regulatory factor (Ser/Thr protein kinase)